MKYWVVFRGIIEFENLQSWQIMISIYFFYGSGDYGKRFLLIGCGVGKGCCEEFVMLGMVV